MQTHLAVVLQSISRGHQDQKKIYRVNFFVKASSAGLTNYVIRHNSKKGNMTSLFRVLGQRHITSCDKLISLPKWCLFTGKDYNMMLIVCKY